LLVELI